MYVNIPICSLYIHALSRPYQFAALVCPEVETGCLTNPRRYDKKLWEWPDLPDLSAAGAFQLQLQDAA